MPNRYALIDIQRADDSFSCAILGTFDTTDEAHAAMQAAYDDVCQDWPDGDHRIDPAAAEAFDGDMWDWNAWHKFIIMDADSTDNRVWF